MNGKINKLVYIVLFAVLYAIVAFSSFWHAVAFMGLANNTWMSVILAGAFEVGQAAVLFALLSDETQRKKVMPWVLMTMFTLVQVLGNVYSSYKHIVTNASENLRFFKEPVFIWTTIPDDQATVIITYLVGGILPISALLLTSMLTSFLSQGSAQLEKTVIDAPPEDTSPKDEPMEDAPVEDVQQEALQEAEDDNTMKTHLVGADA